MGLFSRGPKETLPYEVPGYLNTKAIVRLERDMFSSLGVADHTAWLLLFAAPMLAKDGQCADCFPHYKGKRFEKMEKAFKDNWGDVKESTVEAQLAEMLLGSCTTLLDPLYDMTREFAQDKWDAQIHRISRFSQRQTAKIGDMGGVYRRVAAYGLPVPEKTLLAYDLCRAGNMTCIAVGLEALRPNNAAYYLEQIAWTANQYYQSWEEYYAAYIIGRAFWLWKMEQFLAMGSTVDCNFCHILLHSPQSACARLEFACGMDGCEAPSGYYQPE